MEVSKSKFLFILHGWISLPVWILFSFVCLTGTISVISHEITWVVNPAARAVNPEGLPRMPLPQLVDAVQRAVPDGRIGSIMVNEPYLVTAIGISTREKPNAIAYVNPYSGKVQDIAEGVTFIGFMRSLHGWLLFPWSHSYSFGYYIVTAMSLVVLGATITGIFVYKRFWRSYTRPVLRFGRDSRKVLGDLHRLAGAWSLWFLFIIGVTGLWYFVQAILWHNGIEVWEEPKPVAMQMLPEPGNAPSKQVSLATAIERAQTELPRMSPAWISLPEHNRGYFGVSGKGDALLFDEFSYRAFMNPWDGTVVESRTPASMNLLQSISHLADPLHYGRFGGLWSKGIWFVFGLIVTGMSISGFLIWSKRTMHSTMALLARKNPDVNAYAEVKRELGRSRIKFMASGLLVLAPGWYFYQALHSTPLPEWEQMPVGSITAAPTPAESEPFYTHGEKRFRDFSFRFCDGCNSRIRIAVARIGDSPPRIEEEEGILHGTEILQHVHAPVKSLGSESRLWLTVQEWSGAISSESWELK